MHQRWSLSFQRGREGHRRRACTLQLATRITSQELPEIRSRSIATPCYGRHCARMDLGRGAWDSGTRGHPAHASPNESSEAEELRGHYLRHLIDSSD